MSPWPRQGARRVGSLPVRAVRAGAGRRLLLEGGREVPLIPRYFDLLLLLVERRSEAVSRRLIFDRVWSDVVVSDGALSQAVRTLRRALGDDPREPRYIRTVARHGYRFVFDGVVEEDGPRPSRGSRRGAAVETAAAAGEGASLPLGRAAGAAAGAARRRPRRRARRGPAAALGRRLERPRDRRRRARPRGRGRRSAGRRGRRLRARARRRPGAARRRAARRCSRAGRLAAAAVGLVAHALGRWTIEGLFGRAIPPVGGAVEGLAIGAVVGLAYGLSARPPQGSGLDAPARARAALATGLATAVALRRDLARSGRRSPARASTRSRARSRARRWGSHRSRGCSASPTSGRSRGRRSAPGRGCCSAPSWCSASRIGARDARRLARRPSRG